MLAIETTAFSGSVALLEAGEVVFAAVLPGEQRSAQALAPAVENAMREVGWAMSSLRIIAVAQGPGSFTGLRVGITTAKMLAYALNADILGIDTLHVLAEQAKPPEKLNASIHAIFDAQRQELFAACYTRGQGMLVQQGETRIVPQAVWLRELSAGDWVIGPPLAKLSAKLPADVLIASESDWQPRASTVGLIAQREYLAGRRDDLIHLAPRYLRSSAAEEKRAIGT